MRCLEVGPALHNLPARDSPDYYAAERKPLPVLRIRRCPVIPHRHFVIFRNQVFDLYMQIRKSLQRAAHILNRSRWSWRHPWRHIRPVIHKVRSEVYIPNLHVFSLSGLCRLTAKLFRKFFEESIHRNRRPSQQPLEHSVHRFAPAAGVIFL